MDSRDFVRSADASRRLTAYYVCALSAVALLSIAGQILVQRQLGRQLSDAKVVNLAGRQRMLGQRACKCAALFSGELAGVDRLAYGEELRALLPTWRRTHVGLQQGDDELGLPGDNSPTVAEAYARLHPTFEAMYSAAERVLTSGDGAAARRATADVLVGEAAFLRGMDEIVSLYEWEGRQRVERLRSVERVLLGLTLGVLLLEGLLVFRPAARRIRESFDALRQTGEELLRAKIAAEAADRAKSQFLANVSHELRTPLHAVLGSAELLRHARTEADRESHLDAIDDSGRTLLMLLNDLLDLSKIEAGKTELHAVSFDLHELLRRTTAMFDAAARAKGIELRFAPSGDLPRFVTTDPLRLRQVLANLLNNALKYTDAGSVTLQALPTANDTASDRRTMRFAVVDTGIGIPAVEQHRIFESFTQLRSPNDASRGGVGLGLSIAAQLVGLMGGRLTVASEERCGSTFSFDLVCPADVAAERPQAESTTEARVPSLRILAAEDAPAIRRNLEAILVANGHAVHGVGDGREAVALFERQPFDLVLLDLRMPELDGIAAAAAMRAWETTYRRTRTPIVALTAAAPSTTESADGALAAFDECLVKPFTIEALLRLVGRYAPSCVESERLSSDPHRTPRPPAHLQGRYELLDELVRLFLNDAPQLLEEIETARDEDDRRRLYVAVHRLRGQLEMLEIHDAAAIALRCERACEEDVTDQIRETSSALKNVWPTMCRQVESLASI